MCSHELIKSSAFVLAAVQPSRSEAAQANPDRYVGNAGEVVEQLGSCVRGRVGLFVFLFYFQCVGPKNGQRIIIQR